MKDLRETTRTTAKTEGGEMMRLHFLLLAPAIFLQTTIAHARVYSPSSIEVTFEWQAHFVTKEKDAARDLAINHGKYIFGFMQNPEIGEIYGLQEDVAGIGAPRWEPKIKILSDSRKGKTRTIVYQASGLFLLNRKVADQILLKKEADGSRSGGMIAGLPANLDTFYYPKCGDPEYPDEEQFWYVNDPFRDHCEFMREKPVANDVTIRFREIPQLDSQTPVQLTSHADKSSGKKIFEITSISGFEEENPKRRDDGRIKYNEFNQYFKTLGFRERVLENKRTHTVHLFEKDVKTDTGEIVQIRLIRLLAQTMLDESEDPTFARFVERSFKTSDVVIYDGHSGMGANLSLETIAKKAGKPVVFDRTKKQLFFFNACSSYSYYLSMFQAEKNPGTLAIMTNGLEADFTPPDQMMKFFFKNILAGPQTSLTWKTLLEGMEQPLEGDTYMLNVDIE